MGPSSYFGNTLTDLQSGITASERNSGDTERAKVAADAAKMASYFNLLSNKARTEADAKARQAEEARNYFALNMQDAQQKAKLSQDALLQGQQWAAQSKIAADQNASRIKETEIQFGPNRVDPRVAVEDARQKFETDEIGKMSTALASQANTMLESANAKYRQESGAVNEAGANPGLFRSLQWNPFGGNTERNVKSMEADKASRMQKVDADFLGDVNRILSQVNQAGPLVTFNQKANRFEPSGSAGPAARRAMIPSQLDGASNSSFRRGQRVQQGGKTYEFDGSQWNEIN